MSRTWISLGSLALLAPLVACGARTPADSTPDYTVEIRRDAFGVPHIKADDLPSVSFGAGYAIAQDHGCTIAEQILKVRSERAKFWGPGEDDRHINTDLAYLHIGVYQKAEEHWPELPQEVRDMATAYAAGFNHYLDEVGSEGFGGSCAGEPWVREISGVDFYAYFRELALLASGRQLVDYIATGQPPGSAQLPAPGLDKLKAFRDSPFGSNGWGIGSDLSAGGGGMLLANPHFPWEGELRLWESHFTVPGELDVYGASLLGVPVVLIGFNEAVAWTHTVSAGQRFTFYRLDLVPGEPTTYMREGEEVQMESQEYTIEVLGDDGATSELSRTLYTAPGFGPVLNVDPFGWTQDFAITYRDGNIDNTTLIAQFLAMNKAGSMDEFQAAHEDNLGIPWVNTISTSAEGRAWYIDSTPTPHLSQEAIDAWQGRLDEGEFFTDAFFSIGTVCLEANTSRDDWIEEDGARDPGLVPWSKLPQLERSDFVFNANDSHWMSHPDELLEGYSPLHGAEGTARSVRTRMNAVTLSEGSAGYAGEDGKFDIEELRDAALANRSMSAELVAEDLVARCTATPSTEYEGSTVDLTEACTILGAWDLRFDVDSVGAVLFREFLGDFDSSSVFSEEGVFFEVPFDVADPVGTPNTLTTPEDPNDDRILRALAGAQARLAEAGIPLDAPLGDVQYTIKNGVEIPVHGGGRREGITNLISYGNGYNSAKDEPLDRGMVINGATGLSEKGYVINYGTSFIMTLAFGDAGPEAYSFLTYGQSGDPSSVHFSDQTEAFSQKAWKRILFTEEQLEEADLEVVTLEGFKPAQEAD